jgi:HTH-type transcriptional repressor of NAD biosynthesis genes
MANIKHLPPKKIAILGPESSGKTTLAQALAAELDAFAVPEYFRFYWQAKRHTQTSAHWSPEEFTHMAVEQIRFEDLYAARSKHFLVCDTAVWQVAAWQAYYLGAISQDLLNLAQNRPYDLICLCSPDIPFVQDGMRDGAHSRNKVYQCLQSLLTNARLAVLNVSGTIEARKALVLEAIQSL